MSDEELLGRVQELKIMSRARPLDKQRLVRLLQQRGEVVAVTGDGTNDAPALNFANVGTPATSMGSGRRWPRMGDITTATIAHVRAAIVVATVMETGDAHGDADPAISSVSYCSSSRSTSRSAPCGDGRRVRAATHDNLCGQFRKAARCFSDEIAGRTYHFRIRLRIFAAV